MLFRLLTLKKLFWLLMVKGSLSSWILAKLSRFFKKYPDTIWYDSTNMSRQVIMLMMRFDMILKHVKTCHNAFDAIWYDSQTCLILFRINMIRIDAILKYVKTWRNTQKLSKWYMKRNWKSYSLDHFDERAVKNEWQQVDLRYHST